jgi:hypothetical protein
LDTLASALAGEGGEGQQLLAGLAAVVGGPWQLDLERGDDPVELGVHHLAVRLVEHDPDHGGDAAALALGDLGEQVP